MNIIPNRDIDKIISITKYSGNMIKDLDDKSIKGIQSLEEKIQSKAKEQFKKMYPHHNFLTEKDGLFDMDPTMPTWVLDAIDGTENLKNGLKYCSISLGLVYENDTVFGIVYNPLTNEMFYAEEGEGAFLNGVRIHVSKSNNLLSSFNYTGCASLDLCYVACGKTDAFFKKNLKPWDYAAAACIIKEAGGKITTDTNDNLTYYTRNDILASNGKVHKLLCNVPTKNEVY